MQTVTVEHLTKVYMEHFMLDGISFQANPGNLMAIVGDAVSGKNQLLKVLAGLEFAAGGTVKIEAQECRYVPSSIIAYDNTSVKALFRHTRRLYQIESEEDCEKLCEQFQIDPEKQLMNMTYMENRCVALVNALISKPAVLLLEEPYYYLPDAVYHQLLAVLKRRCAEGLTVLLSCEKYEDVKNYATHCLYLKEGDPVYCGSIAENFCLWKMVTLFGCDPSILKGLVLEPVVQEKGRLCFLHKGSAKELLRLLVRTGCPDFLVEELTFEEQMFRNFERWKKTCLSGN